jgi:hypothetical protein
VLFFGGADTATTWMAMPPSRMSATAARRGTFRSSQAATMNAIHAPISSGSGRSRAGSTLGRTISSTSPASTESARPMPTSRNFAFMGEECHPSRRNDHPRPGL